MSSTRLIVKNLPPKTTQEKLRTSFSAHGILNDVQLKYTKDGKFRNFAFVGFKTEEEASKAQKYFNGTYFGASKIQVEFCADLGDAETKPRSWSKYAKDSSAYQKLHVDEIKTSHEQTKKDKKKERKKMQKEKYKEVHTLMEKYKDDPKFQEFLRVHKRNAAETWNNDAILQCGKAYEEEENHDEVKDEQENVDENEDIDEEATNKKLSDLDYLKAKGL